MSSWAVLSSALSLARLPRASRPPVSCVGVGDGDRRRGGGGAPTRRRTGAAGGGTLEALAAGRGRRGDRIRRSHPGDAPALAGVRPGRRRSGSSTLADLALAVPLAARVPRRLPRAAAARLVADRPGPGFFETAGSACITLGARHAPLAIVSPLASLAAAFTVLYAWAILRERPARGVLIGAALVSAGVVVLAL